MLSACKRRSDILTLYYEVEGGKRYEKQIEQGTLESSICDLVLFASCHHVVSLELEVKKYNFFSKEMVTERYKYNNGTFHKIK